MSRRLCKSTGSFYSYDEVHHRGSQYRLADGSLVYSDVYEFEEGNATVANNILACMSITLTKNHKQFDIYAHRSITDYRNYLRCTIIYWEGEKCVSITYKTDTHSFKVIEDTIKPIINHKFFKTHIGEQIKDLIRDCLTYKPNF